MTKQLSLLFTLSLSFYYLHGAQDNYTFASNFSSSHSSSTSYINSQTQKENTIKAFVNKYIRKESRSQILDNFACKNYEDSPSFEKCFYYTSDGLGCFTDKALMEFCNSLPSNSGPFYDGDFVYDYHPLLWLVKYDKKEAVEILIKKQKIGSEAINDYYDDLKTALMLAISESNNGKGSAKMVELLLQHEDINLDEKDRKGKTALMLARDKGNHRILEILDRYTNDAENQEVKNQSSPNHSDLQPTVSIKDHYTLNGDEQKRLKEYAKEHFTKKHEGEFECGLCKSTIKAKFFTSSQNLYHMASCLKKQKNIPIHTYSCNLCPKTFGVYNAMAHHIKSKHAEIKKQPTVSNQNSYTRMDFPQTLSLNITLPPLLENQEPAPANLHINPNTHDNTAITNLDTNENNTRYGLNRGKKVDLRSLDINENLHDGISTIHPHTDFSTTTHNLAGIPTANLENDNEKNRLQNQDTDDLILQNSHQSSASSSLDQEKENLLSFSLEICPLMYYDLVKNFMHKIEDINEVDSKGKTALMLLSEIDKNFIAESLFLPPLRCPDYVKFIKNNYHGDQNERILHHLNKRDESIKILLERGADIDVKDNSGLTALSYACKNQHTSVIEILLKNNAQISQDDIDELVANIDFKSIQLLLDYKKIDAQEVYRSIHTEKNKSLYNDENVEALSIVLEKENSYAWEEIKQEYPEAMRRAIEVKKEDREKIKNIANGAMASLMAIGSALVTG